MQDKPKGISRSLHGTTSVPVYGGIGRWCIEFERRGASHRVIGRDCDLFSICLVS